MSIYEQAREFMSRDVSHMEPLFKAKGVDAVKMNQLINQLPPQEAIQSSYQGFNYISGTHARLFLNGLFTSCGYTFFSEQTREIDEKKGKVAYRTKLILCINTPAYKAQFEGIGHHVNKMDLNLVDNTENSSMTFALRKATMEIGRLFGIEIMRQSKNSRDRGAMRKFTTDGDVNLPFMGDGGVVKLISAAELEDEDVDRGVQDDSSRHSSNSKPKNVVKKPEELTIAGLRDMYKKKKATLKSPASVELLDAFADGFGLSKKTKEDMIRFRDDILSVE